MTELAVHLAEMKANGILDYIVRITASRLEEIIFLSCLPLVSPHLEYCATYRLPYAKERLINWRELVERLALRKKRLTRDLIALF